AVADRLRRARGEDPHLQLPREPHHRPSHQADDAPARPRAAGRARPVHRSAHGRGPPPRARRVTVREALQVAERELAAARVDTPRVDAELLLAHVLGTSRSGVYAQADAAVPGTWQVLLRRRARREPLAYVLGGWGFRRLVLKTDARALVPRPETEVVVGRALAAIKGIEAPRAVDVGTGSGAIALALADERPDARVTATDLSA